jgi:hypothetical protein
MRTALTILFIAFIASAYAGDSLTRAQVYNYSIGDTFDYQYYTYHYGAITGPYDTTIVSTTYSRYVISNVFLSSDSLTKYICRVQTYAFPVKLDTIVLTGLSNIEVIADSVSYSDYVTPSYALDTVPDFFNQKTNSINYNGIFSSIGQEPFGQAQTIFADQLGPVIMTYFAYSPPSGEFIDTLILIYYSGHAGTYGTPYYYTDAISEPTPDIRLLKVYPTLNAGVFNVEIVNPALLPETFTLYSYTGEKVKDFVLHSPAQTISADELNSGLYIWMASSRSDHQAGKIIIQK